MARPKFTKKLTDGKKVYYGKDNFGYVHGIFSAGISRNKKDRLTPFPIKKGEKIVKLFDPNWTGGVFLPIGKVRSRRRR